MHDPLKRHQLLTEQGAAFRAATNVLGWFPTTTARPICLATDYAMRLLGKDAFKIDDIEARCMFCRLHNPKTDFAAICAVLNGEAPLASLKPLSLSTRQIERMQEIARLAETKYTPPPSKSGKVTMTFAVDPCRPNMIASAAALAGTFFGGNIEKLMMAPYSVLYQIVATRSPEQCLSWALETPQAVSAMSILTAKGAKETKD